MLIVRWLLAIFLLPITVLVITPGVILWQTRNMPLEQTVYPSSLEFWLALVLGLIGIYFAIWTGSLFFRFGNGTAAPWDPPKHFVVRGPYRHVRNPMIIGVFFILLAESILFKSLGIFIWFIVFLLGNIVYIPIVEERGLEKRFGKVYMDYKHHVPRWIPRFRARTSLLS